MNAIPRPALRWHGGKWRLAPWVIEHFPPHDCYVEPFGGAASVLLRKPRVGAEVYNDLDDDVVGLFRVLRNADQAERLIAGLRLTPFARAEDADCRRPAPDADPVERARRLIVRSFMGYGSDACRADRTTGFRSGSNRDRGKCTAAREWAAYPDALRLTVDRLQAVVIEHRDAVEVMRMHDRPTTLHYVDPPYLPTTRRLSHRGHGYVHELTAEDHARLLGALCELTGMVVLSGYPHRSYDAALPGWMRVTTSTHADGAQPRVEALWLNPATQDALAQMAFRFGGAA
ncbi:DNA adenine methylase [Gluconacetobacter azotocaptans]|uniref:DNA adenine methylase n=1 Tax=Gluconacetobacter azotocaptans TaxID=142834 RepID=A0A7W4JQP8_9PROT|nr:DNA adenine methylase [Gluconacetobacter azotocaptans]MBB2189171.1 DNA adenine methylase [Gluconacetobacter azotocaptans]GBQ32137.1 site-specific DNA methylase [Gluconacetobacter azotocaptans DSM 13594]